MKCVDCKYYFTFNDARFYGSTQHRCQLRGFNWKVKTTPNYICKLTDIEITKAIHNAPSDDEKLFYNKRIY